MSKRTRTPRKKLALPAVHGFLGGLPCELWQCQIWPRDGLRQGLIVVSKAWFALAYASVRMVAPGQTYYNVRLQALTRETWERFAALERINVSNVCMRLASIIPALPQLQRLHTMRLDSLPQHNTQLEALGRLTQLTALDLRSYASHFMPYTTALCQLRLLKIERGGKDIQFSHLTALTYLDIVAAWVDSRQLLPLHSLQYLSLDNCACDSYAPLSALTALTALDLNFSRAIDMQAVDVHALATTLTDLAIVGTGVVRQADVIVLTQLRTLMFGFTRDIFDWSDESRATRPFDLVSLDALPVRKYLPETRLIYGDVIFAGEIPEPVKRHGVELARDNEWGDRLNAYRGWSHPLPLNYFGAYHSFIPGHSLNT